MARPVTKDRASVLSQRVDLRVRDDEHKRWVEAAHNKGLTLAAWVRMVLDRAARTG
jgi:predicted HicB family RNase H-like nuclease